MGRLMKERNHSCSQRLARRGGEHGISIVELLIVVAMIAVVTAFAVMQIGAAQRAMRLSNSAREFMGYVEKARLDSIRRHAMSNAEMASVTIASANSYTVTIDQNGDGTLDPPRTITLPGTHGATFSNIAVPTTIRYNWRGRPVDSLGNLVNLSFRLQDSGGNVNPINLTSAGDTSLSNINTSNVTVSEVSATSNIKAKTYGP
jgi:Tfp pilus assembly protein FimT